MIQLNSRYFYEKTRKENVMKKRILLIATMIAMVACLFAICVNAKGIKADSTSIDMTISFYDADYNEISKTMKVDELFNVSYKNEEGEYYFKLTGVKSWNVEIDGTSYNIKSQLAGLYLPEGITHVPSGVADGYWGFSNSVKEHPRKVHLPESLESLGGNFLRGIGHVALVNEDGTFDNYLPSSLTGVNDHLFCNWTIHNEILYFPEGFHNIGSSAGTKWHFEGFSQVNKRITFVFLGEMTFIDFDTNEKGSNPTFIFAKNSASDLWGYALPMIEGSTNVASLSSYISNTDTEKNTLRIYWISKDGENASMNTGAQTATMSSNAPKLIFCEGDKVEYVMSARFCTGSSYPALYDSEGNQLNAQGITGYGSSSWMRFYTAPIAYDMDAHSESNVHYNSIVYQAGNCGYDETTTNTCVICKLQSIVVGVKATGNHTYTDDFNCETALDCEVCKKTLANALIHNLKSDILYENGYDAEGLKTIACQNEGCKHNNGGEKAEAIFTSLGYSASMTGVGGVVLGYAVNNEAISDYTSVTGRTIKYGAFVVSKEKLAGNDIFDANGIVNENAICFEVKRTDFAAFEIKVVGFKDEQKDKLFALGAYVSVNDGDKTEYFYVQDGEPKEGEKYYFTSYKEKAPTDVPNEEVTQ